MDSSNSSDHDVLNFVLDTTEPILHPPTVDGYSLIIEEAVRHITPRLKYMGFRVLQPDEGNAYDQLVASHLEKADKNVRLKQIYVGSIQRDAMQHLFYLSDTGVWLHLVGTVFVDEWFNWDHANYCVDPYQMTNVRMEWLNRESITALLASQDAESLGICLINGLALVMQDVLVRMEQRYAAFQTDHRYIEGVVGRLGRLSK